MNNLKWIETNLRKGTKRPKICRDMYITLYHKEYCLGVTKNSRLFSKEKLTKDRAMEIIKQNDLIPLRSPFLKRRVLTGLEKVQNYVKEF